MGARGNSSELVSFAGRTLPSMSPTQLKQLLTGSRNDPLVKARDLRDQALDQLNAMAKDDGSTVQKQFLDKLATSQTQVRTLAEQLGTTLNAITADDVNGQALAAAALHLRQRHARGHDARLSFGGDNHTDAEPAGRGRPARHRRARHPDGDERARHADRRGGRQPDKRARSRR